MLIVFLVQGRYMVFTPASFRFGSVSFLFGIAVFALSACQPVLQAQTGRTVPVILPAETKTDPAEEPDSEAEVPAAASTLLTAEEASAEPADNIAALITQPDPDEPNQTGEQNQSQTNQTVIVINRSTAPAQPVVTPAFNPADLVGKSQSFVNAEFGQADFSRTEGVIHVLQYRQPDCVIDLFISVTDAAQIPPPADAKIIDWAMRERIVNQTLDLTLCQQQFFNRKL